MKQNKASQRPQKTILGIAPDDIDFGAGETDRQRLTQPIVSSEPTRTLRSAARAGASSGRAQRTLLGGVGSLPDSVQAALSPPPAGASGATATRAGVPTADRAGSVAARSALLPAPLKPMRFDARTVPPASGPIPQLPRSFPTDDRDSERSPASFHARARLGSLAGARVSSPLMELPLNRPVLAAGAIATAVAIWGLAMLYFLGT